MWLENYYFNHLHLWRRCLTYEVYYSIYHIIGHCSWVTFCLTCNNNKNSGLTTEQINYLNEPISTEEITIGIQQAKNRKIART